MTYACRTCDTTFTAPTDTDTVRCPGCGDMVEQQPAVSSPPPDQTALRERIADAVQDGPTWMLPRSLAEEVADAVLAVLPPPADRATVCICGHTDPQHFEDACLVCDCGDYLVPEAAREVIARWRAAAGKAERIRENADFHLGQEMARRQLAEKEADRLSADRAAVLLWAADAVFALDYDNLVSEQDDENLGSMREAWDLGTIHATQLLRRLAAEAQQPEPDDEGDELVCVDECGFCDACGMEPFGTPAEGWREAARFLRRTPRDSTDFPGALRGARLIEDELRRRAEAPQPDTAAPAAAGPGRAADTRDDEGADRG